MKNLLLFILISITTSVIAQNPSDRDPDYNPYNVPINSYVIPYDVHRIGSQSDNKILFVKNNNSIVRLNDNLLDTGFNVTVTGSISDFCVMPDDKIVVVGNFTQCNGVAKRSIVRLNADGTIDESFVTGTGYTNTIFEVEPTATGGVVFSGNASTYNGISWTKKLVRINANGTLDQSFVYDSFDHPNNFKVQPDGKVITLTTDGSFTRFLTNGNTDSGFLAPSESTGNNIHTFSLEPGGKIMLVGSFQSYSGLPPAGVIRLNANGTPDTAFTGPVFTASTGSAVVSDIVRQADGKYVVCGKFTTVGGIICKHMASLNPDGTHNTTAFPGYTETAINNDYFMHLQPNGKIIFAGLDYDMTSRLHYQNQLVTHIFRTNADGTIDSSLSNSTKGFFPFGPVDATQRLDGKVLFAMPAFFTSTFNNQEVGAVVQLNTDWTIDEDFNQTIKVNLSPVSPIGDQTYIVQKVKALDDGKIILMGSFKYTYAGTEYFNFVLLNPDGSVAYGLGAWQQQPADFDIDPATGNILITGNGSFPGSGVRRLLPTGAQDGTFNFSYAGVISNKSRIRQMPNGKIALVGDTASLTRRIFILNSNGSYDSSFPSNTAWVDNLEIGSDGSLLYLNGGGLVKRSASGVVDTAFSSGLLNTGAVAFNVQPDGKIVILTHYLGEIAEIYRANSDGTIDTGFELKTFDNHAEFVTTLRYGKIFVGGLFDHYNNAVDGKSVLLLGEDYYYLVGQNKLDNDVNGCTASDIDFPFLKYEISNGSQTNYHIANYTGSYGIGMAEGTYTVVPKMENPEYFTISPSSLDVTFPGAVNPLVQDFCITPNGSHQDVEVVLIPISEVRPGFSGIYKLLYKNKGNILVSGQVVLTFPNTVMTLDQATPSATASGNQLTWNYTDLWPFESRDIYLRFTLNTPTDNPPLNGGDLLQLVAAISPETGDEVLSDNTFNLTQTLVNSYDPNDKTCLQGNVVSDEYVGSYVHYMIRFENTGNGSAVNVTVTDEIDAAKFDIASLVPLSGSHPFVTRIEGNKVSFVFEDIDLPFEDDANDGYVLFKIRLNESLQNGDTFTNDAEIYFDFNYPIVTNLVNTTIQTLSVTDANAASFVIYPNPATDFCIIATDEQILKVDIFSADGRLVRTVKNPSENRIDMSALTAGYYLLRIEGVNNVQVSKVLKR